MEVIMRTVSEKAEWKKRLRTDGRTDKPSKRHMMKIIIDDFHHNNPRKASQAFYGHVDFLKISTFANKNVLNDRSWRLHSKQIAFDH